MEMSDRFALEPIFLNNNQFVWYAVSGLLGMAVLLFCLAVFYTSGRNKVLQIRNPVTNSFSQQRYALSFRTSLLPGSGLPDSVVIRVSLVGSKGSSPYVTLLRPLFPLGALLRGQEDVFLLHFERSVGEVLGVSLYLENSELLDNKWLLDEVNVYDPQREIRWSFPVQDNLMLSSQKREYRILINEPSKDSPMMSWFVDKFLSLHSLLTIVSLPQEVGLMKMTLKIALLTSTASLLYMGNLVAFLLSHQASESVSFWIILVHSLIGHISVWGISCVCEIIARNIRPKWSFSENRINRDVLKPIRPVCTCCQHYSDRYISHIFGCPFGVHGTGDYRSAVPVADSLDDMSQKALLIPHVQQVGFVSSMSSLYKPRSPLDIQDILPDIDDKNIASTRKELDEKIEAERDQTDVIDETQNRENLKAKIKKSFVSIQAKIMEENIRCLKQFTESGQPFDKLQDEIEAFDKIVHEFDRKCNSTDSNEKMQNSTVKRKRRAMKLGNQTDDDKIASSYSVSKMEKMLEGFEKDLQQDMDTIKGLIEAEKTYNYDEESTYDVGQGKESNTTLSSSDGTCSLHKSTNIDIDNLVKNRLSSGDSSTDTGDLFDSSQSGSNTRKQLRSWKRKRVSRSVEDCVISRSLNESRTCIEDIVEQDFDGLYKEICRIDEHLHSHGVKRPRMKMLLAKKYPSVPSIYRAIYSSPDHIDQVVIASDEEPFSLKVRNNVKKEKSVPQIRKSNNYEKYFKSSEAISPVRTHGLSDQNLPSLSLPPGKQDSYSENEVSASGNKNRLMKKFESKAKTSSIAYRRIERSSLRLDKLLPSGADDLKALQTIIGSDGSSERLLQLEEDIYIWDNVLQNSGANDSPRVQQLLNMDLNDGADKFIIKSEDGYSELEVPAIFNLNKIHMTLNYPLNTCRYIQELKDNQQSTKIDVVKKDLNKLDLVIKDSGADDSPVVKHFLSKKEARKPDHKSPLDFSQIVCPANLLSVSDDTSQWLTNTEVFRHLTQPDDPDAIHELLEDIHVLDTSLKLSGVGSQKSSNRLMRPKCSNEETSDSSFCHSQFEINKQANPIPQYSKALKQQLFDNGARKVAPPSSESKSSNRTITSALKSKSREKVIGLMKSIVDGGEDSNIIQNLLADFQALDKILEESGVSSSLAAQKFKSKISRSSLKSDSSQREASTKSIRSNLCKSREPICGHSTSSKFHTADEGSNTTENFDNGDNIFGRFLEDVRDLELSLQRQGAALSSTSDGRTRDCTTSPVTSTVNLVQSEASIGNKSSRPSSCYSTVSTEESGSEDIGLPTSTSVLKSIACLNSPRKPIRSILEDINYYDNIIHQSRACKPAQNLLPNYLIVKSPQFYCQNSENLQAESLDLDNYILQGLSSRSSCNAHNSESEDIADNHSICCKQSTGTNSIDTQDGLKMFKSFIADPRDAPFLELVQDINYFDSIIEESANDNIPVKRLMSQNVDWIAERESDMAKYEPLQNYSSKEWNDGFSKEREKEKRRDRNKSTRQIEKSSSSKELNTASKCVKNSFNSLSSTQIGFEDSLTFFPTDDRCSDSLAKKITISAELGSEEVQRSDTAVLETLTTPDKRNFLINKILLELNSFHDLVQSLDGVDQDMLDNLSSLLCDEERDLIIELSKPNSKKDDILDKEISYPDIEKINVKEDQNYPAILPPSHSTHQITPAVCTPDGQTTVEIHEEEMGDDFSDIDEKWKNLVPDIPARHSWPISPLGYQEDGNELSYPYVCDCVLEILSQTLVESALKCARQELVRDYGESVNVFHKYLVNATVVDLLKKWKIPAHSDILDRALLDVFRHLQQQGYGRMRRPDEHLSAALLLQRMSQNSQNMFNLDLFSNNNTSGEMLSLKLAEIIGLEKSLADNLRKTYKKSLKSELRSFLKNIKDEVTYSLSLELPPSYLSSVFLFHLDQSVERTKCLPVDVFHQALTEEWTFLKPATRTEENSSFGDTKDTVKEQSSKKNPTSKVGKGRKILEETAKSTQSQEEENTRDSLNPGLRPTVNILERNEPHQKWNIQDTVTEEQTNTKPTSKVGKGKKIKEASVKSPRKGAEGRQVSFNPRLEHTVNIPPRNESGEKWTIENSRGNGDGIDSVTKDVKQLGRYLQYVIHDERRRQELEVSEYCLSNKDKLDNFLVDNLQKLSDFQQILSKEPNLTDEVLDGIQSEVCGYDRKPLPWVVFPCLLVFLCLCIGSSLMYTLLKGQDLLPNESGLWIACVIIGALCEIIIFQPLKILFWILCLKTRRACTKTVNPSPAFVV